jgi:hypothetical protein
MASKKQDQPKQKTRPKKGEPVEIPVPARQSFIRDLRKIAKAKPPQRS